MPQAPPPGKPWVEGDGASAPYVLKWRPAEAGAGRIVGYGIEVRTYGAGGKGSFKPLTGNTGSKAQRYGLASLKMTPGAAYAFRVAALVQLGAGKPELGEYGEPSAPLESETVGTASASSMLPKEPGKLQQEARQASRGRRDRDVEPDPSLAVGDTAVVGDVKREMEAWERQWEKEHGARPSVSDKVNSRQYQALAKRHKQLRRAETAGGGDLATGGGGGGGGGLDRWEVDFERKQGRRPRSADRSGSRYYSETYKKRAELRAKIARLEDPRAGRSERGERGERTKRGRDAARASEPADAAATTTGIDAAKSAPKLNAAASAASKEFARQLAQKAGGDLPDEAGKMSDAALGQAVELFKKYDSDGDGVLGYSEFFALMTELAALAGRKSDPMSLRAVFHQLDVDNSRELDFIEFVRLAATGFVARPVTGVRRPKAGAHGEENLDEAFGEMDAWSKPAAKAAPKNEEDRMIHEWADEFAQDGLTVPEVKRAAGLFKQHDAERRGAVSPRSFFSLMKSIGAAQGDEFSAEELKGMLRRADSDADGDVDFYELLQLLARQKRIQAQKAESELERALRREQQQKAKEDAEARAEERVEAQRAEERQQAAEAERKQKEEARAALRAAELAEEEEEEAREAEELAALSIAMEEEKGPKELVDIHGQAHPAVSRMASMTDQYRSMLLEQLFMDDTLAAHPFMGEGMVECCVSFFETFDHNRNGRLEIDDWVKGMKAYSKHPLVKASGQSVVLHKRSTLETNFAQADTNKDGQLTISEFVRFIGRDRKLNVIPEALSEVAGFELPDDMEYLHVTKKVEIVEQKGPAKPACGNFLAAQREKQAMQMGAASPPVKEEKKAGKAAKKAGFMDRMMQKAYEVVDEVDHALEGDGHSGAETLLDAAKSKSELKRLEKEKAAMLKQQAAASGGTVALNSSFAQNQLSKNPTMAKGLGDHNKSFKQLHPGLGRSTTRANFIKKTGVDTKTMGNHGKVDKAEARMGNKMGAMSKNMGTSKFNSALGFFAAM